MAIVKYRLTNNQINPNLAVGGVGLGMSLFPVGRVKDQRIIEISKPVCNGVPAVYLDLPGMAELNTERKKLIKFFQQSTVFSNVLSAVHLVLLH